MQNPVETESKSLLCMLVEVSESDKNYNVELCPVSEFVLWLNLWACTSVYMFLRHSTVLLLVLCVNALIWRDDV